MSHAPWTKEEADAAADECANINVRVHHGWDKRSLCKSTFKVALEWAANKIEACPTLTGDHHPHSGYVMGTERVENDTHEAKLVGVRPIEKGLISEV